MPLDLNSKKEPIDHTDQQYQDVLQDLQGNILKSHGREESVHIFLAFPDPSKELQKTIALRQLIAQLATQDITSAKKQLVGLKRKEIANQGKMQGWQTFHVKA
jgi:deferrochelatase/peroxidase EfeB